MGGRMYLGNQMVTPVIVQGGGEQGYSELPSYLVVDGIPYKTNIELKGTEFSNIVEIPNESDALKKVFYNFKNLTGIANFESLTSVGNRGLSETFSESGISGVNFQSLESIMDNGLYYFMSGCKNLGESIEFPSLRIINNSGLSHFLDSTAGVKVARFPVLDTVGQMGLARSFYGCRTIEHIYFNALKTSSFEEDDYDAFMDMLSATSSRPQRTHTVHFPSNLESFVQSQYDYPTFGGASGYVVLAFDLPPTE